MELQILGTFQYDPTKDCSSVKHVLFIHKSVSEFMKYLNRQSYGICYDESTSFEELNTHLRQRFSHLPRIGIINHYSPKPRFLNKQLLFDTCDLNNIGLSQGVQYLLTMLLDFDVRHCDFLACKTLLDKNWCTYFDIIERNSSAVVSASSDNTGNLKYGGNWILENNAVNVKSLYFNDLVDDYSLLLQNDSSLFVHDSFTPNAYYHVFYSLSKDDHTKLNAKFYDESQTLVLSQDISFNLKSIPEMLSFLENTSSNPYAIGRTLNGFRKMDLAYGAVYKKALNDTQQQSLMTYVNKHYKNVFANMITTYEVKVSGGQYMIDGVTQPDLTVDTFGVYVFDQSDSTNSGHPLRFRLQSDSSAYTTNVNTYGTPGTPNSFSVIELTEFGVSLQYYCTVHSGSMYGNFDIVQTAIYGFNMNDLSMAYGQFLYLPFLTDSGLGGSTITYSATKPDGASAGTNNDFINIDTTGTYTIVATKSGGSEFDDVSSTCYVSLTTSASDEEHLTSIPSKPLTRVHEDYSHRYVLANLWPGFDGFDTYNSSDYGFPQSPIPRGFFEKVVSLRLPKRPTYPAANFCQTFSSEFGDSTEISYNTLDELPAQFYVTAVLGRLTTPNVHWSETHCPNEMVILDPLPAACGGKFLETSPLTAITEANGEQDLMTAKDCGPTWDTKYVTPSGGPQNSYSSFTESDVSGTFYRPGYYFRYYLTGIQNDTWDELQMDDYGGHIQPDNTVVVNGQNEIYGDWHAHTAFQMFGTTAYSNCVIGYGVDGTPIMGGYSTVYDSQGTNIGTATPSWRRRSYPSEYDVSYSLDGNGYFIYDYKHDADVAGANLDEFNGGYTILDGVLTYCYFLTQTYPIWPRNIRGAVSNMVISSGPAPPDAISEDIVTMVTVSNGEYYLDNVARPFIDFSANKTYVFDQTDSTNTGHPIVFGFEIDNSSNILSSSDGVTNVGTPGQSGAYSVLDLSAGFIGPLYYYCYNHSNMGSEISNYDILFANVTEPSFYWDFRTTTPLTDGTGDYVEDVINGTIKARAIGDLSFNDLSGPTFNGSDDIQIDSFTFGGACSIEVYFYITQYMQYGRIIDFASSAGGGDNVIIRVDGQKTVFQFRSGSTNTVQTVVTGSTTINLNTWYHAIVTVTSSGSIEGYVDTVDQGINATFNAGSGVPTVTRNVNYVGDDTWNTANAQHLNGKMSFVRIWHGHVLSSSEISSLYNNRDLITNDKT